MAFKRVKGPIKKARTPGEKLTKGSWLLRHYKGSTNQKKEFKDDKGRPTRHALQAKRWGEPIPQNQRDRAKLVRKGEKLLQQYRNK